MNSKFNEVQNLVAQGQSVTQACKQIGWHVSSYYYHKGNKKQKAKRTYKKRKISVLDISEVTPAAAQRENLFIVFGSAQSLAEFAKVYQ